MRCLVAAVFLLPLAVSGAGADDPPPADSVAAVLDESTQTLRHCRQLAPVLGLDSQRLADAAPCDFSTERNIRCAARDFAPCMRALPPLYRAVRAVRSQPSAVRSAAAALLAREVAAVALRMQTAAVAGASERCERAAGPGDPPARILPSAAARTLLIEPLTPLQLGRRYALVIDGLSVSARDSVRRALLPQIDGQRLRIPGGAFADPVAARETGLDVLDLPRTVAFVHRLERETDDLAGLPATAGVSITLPTALSPEQLTSLRAYFLPAEKAAAGQAVAIFPVLDVRAGLLAYRAALANVPCAARPARPLVGDPVLAGPFPHVGSLLRVDYESFDLGTGSGPAGILGAASDGQSPRSRPLLLALPKRVTAQTPVVLLVSGIRQTAASMLASHADGLTARGMAVAALELPHHGERSDGKEFLDVLDPTSLSRNLRQAAVDVMAAVHAARTCGFALSDGTRVRPPSVRYAGYSLGAMIGTIARAVEPDLGATVLLAPGGDLPAWLGIHVAHELGSSMLVCIGGPDDGRSCLERRACASPGVCYPDPSMLELSDGTRLLYALATAGGEPLAFAGTRGTDASQAPLLLLTGGIDAVLPPHLATRLAAAYAMDPVAPGRWQGRDRTLVQWPALGHELSSVDGVRTQAYDFLAAH